MMTSLWLWFKTLFTSKVGALIKTLLIHTGITIADEILDKENQAKAYEFVKELNNNTELTTKEKAELFNKKFIEWAKSLNKEIATSIINCLRELAVNAIKCEMISASSKK